MKSTGIVRKVDELGRIVLPIEMRRTLARSELITVIRLKCFSMERTSFSANMRRAAYSVEIRRKSSNTRVSEYAGIV